MSGPWGRPADALVQGEQPDAASVQVVGDLFEVADRAPEPVEPVMTSVSPSRR